jgi:endoglucanase
VVVAEQPVSDFTVRRAADGSVAYHGKLSPPTEDADSGDRVRLADFTPLTEAGKFYLDVSGVGRSWEFRGGRDVYARVLYLSMRSFYGQRCGTAVDLGPEFPGYRHAACHTSGVYHPSSGGRGPAPTARGWHDAGDYGRYVVNSGISTGTLLWTWELFGRRLGRLKLDIPESGNKAPDFLDEIRWNLDWMLSMQDADGGVWHKQTSERFADFVMPERDALVSQVIGTGREPFKSSCATADFAAVTAVAARIYKPFDAAYSRKNLDAARRAWAWLDRHPTELFINPAGVSTGEYGDRVCEDERLWAAAELWRTTREDVYHRHFLKNLPAHQNALRASRPPSWADVAALALWSYALGGDGDAAAKADIKKEMLRAADDVYLRTQRNGYRVSLRPEDYEWGSNSVVANYGMQLLVANAVHPDRRYVEAALENLHYLLGRNTFSLSFVTRVGANPFRHPHHRPSAADRNPEPWPGLLSGGPNRNRQDPAMKKLGNLPPAKMYLDAEESYASNEIAINWNAPLVFLLAGATLEQ